MRRREKVQGRKRDYTSEAGTEEKLFTRARPQNMWVFPQSAFSRRLSSGSAHLWHQISQHCSAPHHCTICPCVHQTNLNRKKPKKKTYSPRSQSLNCLTKTEGISLKQTLIRSDLPKVIAVKSSWAYGKENNLNCNLQHLQMDTWKQREYTGHYKEWFDSQKNCSFTF